MYSEKLSADLSSLCTSSLESRARCSWDAEPCQALRQAVGASTGERERPVPAAILLSRWHQALLALSVSVALCLSAVFGVAAPLPPEAGTLLAAQMVQRRCPFGWALEQHTQVVTAQQCVCECGFFFFFFLMRVACVSVRSSWSLFRLLWGPSQSTFPHLTCKLTFSAWACVLLTCMISVTAHECVFWGCLKCVSCVFQEAHPLFWASSPPGAAVKPSAVQLLAAGCWLLAAAALNYTNTCTPPIKPGTLWWNEQLTDGGVFFFYIALPPKIIFVPFRGVGAIFFGNFHPLIRCNTDNQIKLAYINTYILFIFSWMTTVFETYVLIANCASISKSILLCFHTCTPLPKPLVSGGKIKSWSFRYIFKYRWMFPQIKKIFIINESCHIYS